MICVNCVTAEPLKNFVMQSGSACQCVYCGNEETSVQCAVLFAHIFACVDENVSTLDDLSAYEVGMIYEGGSDQIAVQDIDIVLAEWMGLGDEKYFDDLMKFTPAEYLHDANGHSRHFYYDDGTLESNLYELRWKNFEDEISHGHRFFNVGAADFLKSVFAFLYEKNGTLKQECVRTLPIGTEIFRARTVANVKQLEAMKKSPTVEFALAPKKSVSSQRMTPHGIAALYCAFDRKTCLSEIRSITGEQVVSVAFTPIKDLKFLDLTKFASIEGRQMSLLETGSRDNTNLQFFIRSLVQKMSRPKGRSDELLYLSTQVVFEFLRVTFGSQVQGLIYPSVQTGETGLNLVFFPEFCKISEIFYTPATPVNTIFGVEPEFEEIAILAYVANSMRFHRIKAIETIAQEYDNSYEMSISDAEKRRFGFAF